MGETRRGSGAGPREEAKYGVHDGLSTAGWSMEDLLGHWFSNTLPGKTMERLLSRCPCQKARAPNMGFQDRHGPIPC